MEFAEPPLPLSPLSSQRDSGILHSEFREIVLRPFWILAKKFGAKGEVAKFVSDHVYNVSLIKFWDLHYGSSGGKLGTRRRSNIPKRVSAVGFERESMSRKRMLADCLRSELRTVSLKGKPDIIVMREGGKKCMQVARVIFRNRNRRNDL